MKRYGNLYAKIWDKDNIRLAHKNAQRGKKHYKEVRDFIDNEEYYLEKIHLMLKNETFVNSKYEIFITNDKGKEREIYKLPYFPDRVVHHAIMQILEPIWKKTLITDTYQSITGRGVHKAKTKIEVIMRKHNPKYCLKLDIQKFYPSIDNEILKKILRKKIKCQATLKLLYEIIDSTNGVPIGNYLSQYFGNLYLTYFDHWAKETKQIKWYFRYCDDIMVLRDSKSDLHKLLREFREYLSSNLKLTIKSDHQVFLIEPRGVDYLGFRFFGSYTLLRTKIKRNMIKSLKEIELMYVSMYCLTVLGRVASYNGWCRYSDGNNLWNEATANLKKVFYILKLSNRILIRK